MQDIIFIQKAVIKNPIDQNKFLVLIRNKDDKSRPGDFDIPGGSVKNAELHMDALKREILEETDLNIKDVKPVFVNSHVDPDDGKYFLYIGYSCVALSEEVKVNPKEHSEFTWLTVSEFIDRTDGHILLKHLESVYPNK